MESIAKTRPEIKIEIAESVEDYKACIPVFQALIPSLPKDEKELLEKILLQVEEGYKVVFIRDPGTSEVVSVLGYRILRVLMYPRRMLYIDDICTLPNHTGKGYAGALMKWVINKAKEEDCKAIDLDSGYNRKEAHRLYLNHGFKLTMHHFHSDL